MSGAPALKRILRPSALPILAKSPLYVAGDTNEAIEAGTYRHKMLPKAFRREPEAMFDLEEEEAEALTWAAEQVRILAPTHDQPIQFEQRLTIDVLNLPGPMTGTADATCGAHIFDLKWRPRDYDLQMAAYALGLLQKTPYPLVWVHVLFGATRRVRTLEFDLESATRLVSHVVDLVNQATECRTSEYCSWCAIQHRCQIYVRQVEKIAAGREDWPAPKTWHSSKINDPVEMGKALRIARLVRGWVEAVEHHAMELAQKEGMVPVGFELKQIKARQWVGDVGTAFTLAGLDQANFLSCCDLRLVTSAKYPDKVGAANVYAEVHGMKKAPAKRELLKKLEPVLRAGKAGMKLKAIAEEEGDDDADL